MSILGWDQHIDELGPALYRYFCASLASEIADDCVQETLIRLMQKIEGGQFDQAKGSLRMYAYGIAHFVRLEAFKVVQFKEVEENHLINESNHDDELAHAQELYSLRRAIKKLNEIQQQVLLLYMDEELTIENIGALMNMPVGTVKSHMHRAKEELKVLLQGQKEVVK